MTMRYVGRRAALVLGGTWLALTVVGGPASLRAQQTEIRAGDLVISGGRLFDATGDEVRANPGILIRNGTIVSVGLPRVGGGDSPGQAGPPGVRIVELDDGDFVMPGLFDLHAHYAVDLFGEGRVDEYTVNPVVFLANGVTSTFPAGEVDPEEARRGRARIARGEIPGPRIYSSGPYFGSARPGWKADAMTPDSIRREVDLWAERGVRGFKAKAIRPEQLAALIAAAHRHGLSVTGHLGSGFRGTVNPRDAILMGIDRVEHFLGGDALPDSVSAYASLETLDLSDPETGSRVRRQAELFVRQGVYFDATLTAYGYFADREAAVYERWFDEMGLLTPRARAVVESRLPRRPLDQFGRIYSVKRRTVKAFYDAGGAGLLTLGTDHPSWGEFLSGFGAHRELHAMVLAGIPPAAALRAATVNGARALGVGEHLGTLESGKYADLVVVRGDPLTDIRDTRHVKLVVKAGEAYDPVDLLRSVLGRLGPAEASEDDWWRGRVRLGR